MSGDDANRSKAIGAGIGVGIGAGWGIVMAQVMDGDVSTGLVFGAGVGLVVALISGVAVYHTATTE